MAVHTAIKTLRKAVVLVGAAFAVVGAGASVLKTPGGKEISFDVEAAKELGLRGVLIIEVAERYSGGVRKAGEIAGYQTAREIIVFEGYEEPPPLTIAYLICDFERSECYFLDLTGAPDGAWPLAFSRDRRTAFLCIRTDLPPGENDSYAVGAYDRERRTGRYFPLRTCPESDIFYDAKEGAFFYSVGNREMSKEKGYRVDNVVRMDARTGDETYVTPLVEDTFLYAVADEAGLLLVGEWYEDRWGGEDVILWGYDGERREVLLEENLIHIGAAAPHLSADGNVLVVTETHNHSGFESTKSDIYVWEKGSRKTVAEDNVSWSDYEVSRDGRYLGVITTGYNGAFFEDTCSFLVVDLETLRSYDIIKLPSGLFLDLIRWGN
jgi:hypothetical protein